MKLVCKPPRCPYVIDLLEWFETPVSFILILERPDPCINLYMYCRCLQGKVPEAQARTIMQQVVQALRHCHDRGVFHRDIKLDNVLLNTQTFEVKLIDFGYGYVRKDTPYTEFGGNCASGMRRFYRNSVLDYFCDLADETLSLSSIQPLQFSSHCRGPLQMRTRRNLSQSGIWAYSYLACQVDKDLLFLVTTRFSPRGICLKVRKYRSFILP